MARLGINTGTTANDGTGDTLLVAGGKVNSNFSEIYNIIGDGTNTFVGVVTQITAGNNLVTVGGPGGISTSYGSVVVSGVGQTGYINAADLSVSGITTLGIVTGATYYGDAANLTNIPAGNLTGTVADARISTLTASKLSGALPAISGANLTDLDASDLASGTVPDARFPATLPALNGSALTNLNGSNHVALNLKS